MTGQGARNQNDIPFIPPVPNADGTPQVPSHPEPLSPADAAYAQAGQVPPAPSDAVYTQTGQTLPSPSDIAYEQTGQVSPPPVEQQASGVSAQVNPPQQGFPQDSYGQVFQSAYAVPASASEKKSKLWILWIIIPILLATCLLLLVIFPLRALLSPESPAEPMGSRPDYTTVYTEGDYSVGSEIEPGLYYLKSTDSYDAYFEIRRSGMSDIYSNDNIPGFTLIELEQGYDITISRASMHRIDPDEPLEVNDKIVSDGMYRVGLDIPAGEYRVDADADSPISAINMYSDMSHSFSSFTDNITFDAGTTGYFTAREGTYIQVKRATLEKIIGDEPVSSQPPADTFGVGMFRVGTDIASGDYFVYADDPTSVISLELSSDASGMSASEIGGVSSVGRAFIHVENGQYLSVHSWAGESLSIHGVPFSQATPATSPYHDSDFLVGFDLAPGVYTIVPDEEAAQSEGWVTIYTDTTYADIVDIYSLKPGETGSAVLSEGQVLSLSKATANRA